MSRLFFLLAFVTLLVVGAGSGARAQAWVQVEAQPTLAEAEARARIYSRDFPNVNGYQLRSGWYAIAIGPFAGPEAAQRLQAMRAARVIPGDSFVADGSNFARQFWPVAGAVVAPQQPEVAAAPEPAPAPPAVEPAPADETPAQARQSEALLTREERQEIQTALAWEGFYASGIDGAFGPGSRAAMAAWQEAHAREATGVLTTLQRQELLGAYRGVIASLGLRLVRDNSAGIEVQMPTAMVTKGAYQPPFAHYDGDKVHVILISQEGDRNTLYGLYDILQTLQIVPLDGPRSRGDDSFTIDGSNEGIITHAEARLTPAGAIKGFILVWPTGDEKRRAMVLEAMKSSFTVIPDAVLPDRAGDGAQSIDLLSGLEIRRPERVRSGFYVDAAGRVLTTADAVAGCGRITLDADVVARVVAQDAGLGIALLAPEAPLAPSAFAAFLSQTPRLQSEIAVSGYSYDGKLGAPVLTFGRLAELKGLSGQDGVARLALNVTPGDAGGPVLDGSGAVVGLLLPPETGDRVLPADTSFAAEALAIAGFLAAQGVTATQAQDGSDIPPEDLTRRAREMTVEVSCWN